jgi:hypothetical protein
MSKLFNSLPTAQRLYASAVTRRILEALIERTRTVPELIQETRMSPRRIQHVLRSLIALDLIEIVYGEVLAYRVRGVSLSLALPRIAGSSLEFAFEQADAPQRHRAWRAAARAVTAGNGAVHIRYARTGRGALVIETEVIAASVPTEAAGPLTLGIWFVGLALDPSKAARLDRELRALAVRYAEYGGSARYTLGFRLVPDGDDVQP